LKGRVLISLGRFTPFSAATRSSCSSAFSRLLLLPGSTLASGEALALAAIKGEGLGVTDGPGDGLAVADACEGENGRGENAGPNGSGEGIGCWSIAK